MQETSPNVSKGADPKAYAESLAALRDLIIGNVVFLGEIPSTAVTFQSDEAPGSVDYSLRAKYFGERLVELGVDECSSDDQGNPVGIIKGKDSSLPPILVTTELDSLYEPKEEYHYSLDEEWIYGPGIMDNVAGAAAALCLPEALRRLGLQLSSDLLIAGFAGTMRKKQGIAAVDYFLANLNRKPRGAVILKGGEFGRLNYYTEAVVRANILCTGRPGSSGSRNMIVAATGIVDSLLAIRLPQKPRTEIVIGRFEGGFKYGVPAPSAIVGIEVRSTSNTEINRVMEKIATLVERMRYEQGVDVRIETAAQLGAASLGFEHPLTRAAVTMLYALGEEPHIYPSVSELIYFLERSIPAVTIGVANGSDWHQEQARIRVSSIYKGLAQAVSIIQSIDEGACDA
jgi:tripeptide aminopeptidase